MNRKSFEMLILFCQITYLKSNTNICKAALSASNQVLMYSVYTQKQCWFKPWLLLYICVIAEGYFLQHGSILTEPYMVIYTRAVVLFTKSKQQSASSMHKIMEIQRSVLLECQSKLIRVSPPIQFPLLAPHVPVKLLFMSWRSSSSSCCCSPGPNPALCMSL